MQRYVLVCLSLRVDWRTGRGLAALQALMEDASASKNTVKRATKWGRQAELLLQTRRGHRIDSETRIASEWQLTQPATGDTLATTHGPTGGTLGPTQSPNGDDPRSQSGTPKVP